MQSAEFIAKLKDIAAIRTTYMWGMFGGLVTEARLQEKTKQYRSYYSAVRQAQLRKLIGKGVYAFDCVGLIKGILWGWRADPSPLGHGGAKYESIGLRDLDANQMIAQCKDVSTDFSRIVPGCAVWMQGHIGIYIGNGRVIEATPSWQDGVQETACLNIAPIAGLNGRRWIKHGKLPWVEYVQEPVPAKGAPTTINLGGKRYPATIKGDITVLLLQTLVDMLGPDAEIPLRAFAEAMGFRVHWNQATRETTLRR